MNVSPARCSLLIGLLVLMLVSVPRYYLGGHDTHLAMLLLGGVGAATLAIYQWWQLSADHRHLLGVLVRRLAALLAAGIVLMGLWQALFATWTGWPVLVSHGATLGLLLHAMGLWWKPSAAP
ncbi:hypothetical protein OM427_20015 [Halomonas sp. 18H]|uniref:hypothetical protein n=1 Tax=Halomonas almeriensis TaxID=308163 RepID=UPI00222F0E8A|nr:MULTISPECIES: hypothetical protein [Halomonas]MCW4151807.1 hypothetical protein [Halomonas sp. 18H]MDN3554053.1 hypothetical protein [Halomonas almeriensis]